MVKDRISTWKLDKKHKVGEMRTALHISIQCGYCFQSWLYIKPMFLIRGRMVSTGDIARYWRRKDVYEPFAWHLTHLQDDFELSPEVAIIQPPNIAPLSSYKALNDSPTRLGSNSATNLPETGVAADHVATQLPTSLKNSAALASNSPGRHLSSPLHFGHTEQMVWLTKSYCSSYLESHRAMTDSERPVNHFTVYGRFGHDIQDGISAVLYQGGAAGAFRYFHSASDKLEELLRNSHPMALAQLYAVLCELASRASAPADDSIAREQQEIFRGVLGNLVRHIASLSSVIMQTTDPIKAVFDVLARAEHFSEQLLTIMQSTVDSFEQAKHQISGSYYWKLLYLKERYCDCLYHAGVNGTRQALRARLLTEQEEFYGSNKSNVLWTLTNVADDFLDNHRPSDAQRLFEDALRRAESLDPFARAKIRFAALEGLAKTTCWKAHHGLSQARLGECARSSVNPHASHVSVIMDLLRAAESFCIQAEAEARDGFGTDSRRFIRMAKKREEIACKRHEIAQINMTDARQC